MADSRSSNARAGTKTKPLSIALMLVLFLAAMETTITALATPTITRDLAGFDLMSLVFSSYLLLSAITTPVFGRLADAFGRKRVLIAGIAIFLAGSMLCGLSQSMVALIVFRGLQGIGAGAILTLSYTIAGDVFPLESRGAIMGALSAVWGVAGLAGPLLGGFLIDTLSWHWIFFVNVPLGILALVLVQVSLKETRASLSGRGKRPDLSGVVTRLTVLVNAVSFLACISMVGIDVYLALFLQTVLGYSPTIAGLSVFPMAISWFLVSLFMGKLLIRFKARNLVIASGLILLACLTLLIFLDETSPLPFVVSIAFLGGFGLGGLLTSTTMMIQESVGYSKRGTAMGINSFIKSMGQTVGITTLGAMLNARLAALFVEWGFGDVDTSTLLQQESAAEAGADAGAGAEAASNTDATDTSPSIDVASDANAASTAAADASSDLSADVVIRALESGVEFLFWVMLTCTAVLVLIALFIPDVQLGEGTLDEQEPS